MNPQHSKSTWSDNHPGEEDGLAVFYVSSSYTNPSSSLQRKKKENKEITGGFKWLGKQLTPVAQRTWLHYSTVLQRKKKRELQFIPDFSGAASLKW